MRLAAIGRGNHTTELRPQLSNSRKPQWASLPLDPAARQASFRAILTCPFHALATGAGPGQAAAGYQGRCHELSGFACEPRAADGICQTLPG